MKKTRRILCLLLAVCLFGSGFSVSAAPWTPSEDSLNSAAVYMVNTDTGTVVYKQNEHKKLYPASFVKIMVALMVLEKYPNPKKIMVTAPNYIFDDLAGTGASNADIRHGEKLSMLDLLYALMLPSACEAASIIADYMGNGSIPDFIEAMNKRAEALGCTDTHFVNPHGLHDAEQLTSAYDMYLITKQALTIPLFKKISTTYQYTMAKTNKHSETRNIYHTNEMLRSSSRYYYPYAKGIKTGTTDESGRNLVSMASKEGYNYLLVTMSAPVIHENGTQILDNLCAIDQINLYDWAFDNYAVKTILEKDKSVADVKVKLSWDTDHVLLTPKEDVNALLKSDVDPSSVQQIAELPESVNAPLKKGEKVGTMSLRLAGETIASVDLVASEDVKAAGILAVFNVIKGFFSSFVFKIILTVLLILVALYIAFVILYNRRRRRRRRPPKRRKVKMKYRR